MQACDQTCSWCAREFWRWVKAREAQMWAVRKRKGETRAFNAEIVTSRLKPGVAVTFGNHRGIVRSVSAYIGVDGVRRCAVDFQLDTWTWAWSLDVNDVHPLRAVTRRDTDPSTRS